MDERPASPAGEGTATKRRILALGWVAALLVACTSVTPAASPTAPVSGSPSTSPGASVTARPSSSPPGATATANPTNTATVTTGPTDTPTSQPTPTPPPTPAPPTYNTTQAASHIGTLANVCGHVAAANFAPNSTGLPTFLNLDSAYPSQTFNIVIWGVNRADFSQEPEVRFMDQDVCVVGVIQQYKTWLQVQAGKPQITIQH